MVEDGEALRTISAYLDLNPVRAGLVDDPKDYRWGGYAEAMAWFWEVENLWKERSTRNTNDSERSEREARKVCQSWEADCLRCET
jgi:hypothetical protein